MSDAHSCSQLGLFDTVSGTAINLGNRGSGSRVSGLVKEACVEPQPGLIKVSFISKNLINLIQPNFQKFSILTYNEYSKNFNCYF